jgi:hypothetical protein
MPYRNWAVEKFIESNFNKLFFYGKNEKKALLEL